MNRQVKDIILVPKGLAWIGSEKMGESPKTLIYVPSFYIGKYTVSNKEYQLFIEDGGYDKENLWTKEGFSWMQNSIQEKEPFFWKNPLFNEPNQPVTGISLYEAMAFAKWAGGRLPTEIEWEKSSRGSDGQTYPWGEKEPSLSLANYSPDFVPFNRSSISVFDFYNSESPFGCRQTVGNVFEWCIDYFHFDTPLHRGSSSFKYETRKSDRYVLKGGAWTVGASRIHSSSRWSFTPTLRDNILGFRVAFDLLEGEKNA